LCVRICPADALKLADAAKVIEAQLRAVLFLEWTNLDVQIGYGLVMFGYVWSNW
jgi:ferredoxin